MTREEEGAHVVTTPNPSDDRATDSLIPLSGRNADGVAYQRAAEVEHQIRAVARLRPDQLRARASITESSDPDFLKEEALVYLIRRFLREQPRLASDLSEALIRRCGRILDAHLRKLGPEAAAEGYRDGIERLFRPILDLKGSGADFLEVRFWVAMERIAIRVFHEQLKRVQAQQRTVPITSLPGYDQDDAEDVRRARRRTGDLEGVDLPEDPPALQDSVIRDAVSRIRDPNHRSAFLLRHYYGWPIEDQDPTVRTISRHFDKDPRTIRNWLKAAEKDLNEWRGEQP